MAGRDFWMSLAENADTDDLRDRILAGYKDGKPFTPYVPTIPMPEPPITPKTITRSVI